MKKIKLSIKNRFTGSVIFEYENDGNNIKETVRAMLKQFTGTVIKEADLSNMDLAGVDFYNSKFYNSTFYNSKFYNSTFYNSTFDNSTFDNSKFDNSKFYNSTFDNSKFYNSKFYNSTFYNSTFDVATFESLKDSGALEPVRCDFFGRMLILKNEVPYLKQALVDGKVNGSSYEAQCACFMGTVAHGAKLHYTKLPGLRPDASSDTERWFMAINEGDTPENSLIVKQTIEWIEEFEQYLKA